MQQVPRSRKTGVFQGQKPWGMLPRMQLWHVKDLERKLFLTHVIYVYS